jgi:hypothetical protein
MALGAGYPAIVVFNARQSFMKALATSIVGSSISIKPSANSL